jgi:CheY-like chemotaxis protein
MTPKRIFLVDDDNIFVFLTKKIIESTALETVIDVFGNGQEVLDHLLSVMGDEEKLADIIFLDLSMPVMDGWDFLEEYIQLEPKIGKKIKLYLVSSTISPHDIERAKSIGVVSDFFIKPLVKEKIIELINN